MDLHQIKGYDFTGDIIQPRNVMEHLRAHDARMEDDQPQMALNKAAFTTRFWHHIEGVEDYQQHYELSRLDQIEVNRIKPAISAYLSSLYPRRIEVVLSPSPYTTGNAEYAEMVANDWLNQPRMRDRVLTATRQALLYKGAGAKIGYDPAAEGLSRVWMRVFPYWEMVLDCDVHDWEDARFFGHVSFRPKEEIIDEYGLEEDDIGGTSRDDFLGSFAASARKRHGSDESAPSDSTAFCRVLEFCNLIDDFHDADGNVFKGRLEIYILDEGQDPGEVRPVYMGPLPLVNPRGQPLAHIVPLIFEHEPEYPYRGISYADQLMPQQKEINALRSFISTASRRDSRIYLARKGALDADAFSDLKSGEDGLIIEVDDQYAGAMRDVVVPIQHGPTSSNILQSMSMADSDIERNMVMSPAALGQITKATAEEVRAVERHTESEFGRYAEQRDLWLIAIVERCLAAYVASSYDTGDSEGAEQHVDEDGIEIHDEDDGGDDSEPLSNDDISERPEGTSGEKGEDEDVEEHPLTDPEEGREDAELKRSEQKELVLRLPNGELITVAAEDLDSDFVIGFAEAGRTPMADAELRQNLVGLMDTIMSLYDQMHKGGPMAVMSEEMLRTLHDKFQLPPNLHPDYLKNKEAEMGGTEQPAPQGSSPLDALRQMPPDQALAAMAQSFGNNPELMQMVQRAQSLPAEQQAEAVAIILDTIEQRGGM
jgi:hypothetical protein